MYGIKKKSQQRRPDERAHERLEKPQQSISEDEDGRDDERATIER